MTTSSFKCSVIIFLVIIMSERRWKLQTVFSSTAATTIARLVMKFNQISYLAVVMN